MTKEIIKREVNERVNVMLNIDPTTVKELGDGVFTTTVTTSTVDRMNESIDTAGITTDAYMNNPVVLYGHDYSGLPIGKTTKLTAYKNKMVATFQLAVKEYPFAATVAALIKGGYINAVSIGGIVKAWNEDYTQILGMEMVEFSICSVPANPEALISGRSLENLTGKSLDQISQEFKDFAEKSIHDRVKSLDNDEILRHIESLEKLLTILKASAEATSEASGEETSQSEQEIEKITLTIRKTAGKVSQTGQEIIKLVKARGKINE